MIFIFVFFFFFGGGGVDWVFVTMMVHAYH